MRWKQLAIVWIGTVLVGSSLPLSAFAQDAESADNEQGKYDTKDEAIYGNLDVDGTLQDMYVVNTFHIEEPGSLTDHGEYTDVRNLTNLTELEQDGNEVHFRAKEGDDDFYYQGFLENQPLPWNIDITYLLDGKEMDPKALAGKDGSMEIQIETSGNEDVDSTFFENYMMQISLVLDPTVFKEIQAPDGTKAKEGKDTNVTFTVMPDEAETFIVSTEVTAFEMDPINISATPASMPIDDPDLSGMKGDMRSLSDAIQEVNDGVADLQGGISELNNGAVDLKDGSSSYLNGIQQLDQSSGELVSGSSEIKSALEEVASSVQGAPDEAPDMSELNQVPAGMRAMADGLEQTAAGLDELRKNYDEAYSHLDGAIGDIPEGTVSEAQIKELLGSDVNQEVVNELVKNYEAAQQVKGTYQEVKEAFAAVTGTLKDVSGTLREIADNANATATEIENGMANMDGLDELGELQAGMAELSSQYQSFHQGLVEYTDGVSDLSSNYQQIDEGISGLADGTSSLVGGVKELHEGTAELEEETSDLPGDIQSEVDEMLEEFDGSDFEPVSFVSDKNDKVDVVQFVLKTEPIEIEEPETTDNAEEAEKGFWDRLLDLFR